MNHIFYIIGKSCVGKDTIYNDIINNSRLKDNNISLNPIIMYTTRPIRDGEVDGVNYHFTDINTIKHMLVNESDSVIECRTYNTAHGEWIYLTSSKSIDLEKGNYIGIGTLESYNDLYKYYKDYNKEIIIPIYITIDEYTRAKRALEREYSGKKDYSEMYRRLYEDLKDFSDENLNMRGITKDNTYYNYSQYLCVYNIVEKIIKICNG